MSEKDARRTSHETEYQLLTKHGVHVATFEDEEQADRARGEADSRAENMAPHEIREVEP